MADGAAGSCLSDLSDDLLRHILLFAPAKEGATTAVLSRRWRWLWRTSGAVNLDSRSWKRRRSSDEPSDNNRKRKRSRSRSRSSSRSRSFGSSSSSDSDSSGYRITGNGFVRSAEQALAAAASPIRRLTFFVANAKVDLTRRRRRRDGSRSAHNLAEALISNPAARRVEELRIEAPCRLSFGCLPSEALRVLHMRRSTLTAAPAPGAGFACLADLHLQRCIVGLEDLLSTIAAAPQLSMLHLQSSYFSVEPIIRSDQAVRWYRFFCPAVTALVIANCQFGDRWGNVNVELDVPRLQYFRYEGSLQAASHLRRLKPQAASNDMIRLQVDLHLTSDRHCEENHAPIRNLFWQFVQDFNTARLLKLKLDLFMDNIVLSKEDKGKHELLGRLSFCRLEQLELETKYNPKIETSTVLLADLLHCCPVVRDLRLKFIKVHEVPGPQMGMCSSVDKEAGVDYHKSVNGFRNRRRLSLASLSGENDESYQHYGIIPGLTSERAFSCLQSHLERVSLQFCMDDPNCLGVQLAKFFAENAMVLQEMHIDDGSQEMLEHVNCSLRTWIDKEKLGKVGEMRRIKLLH